MNLLSRAQKLGRLSDYLAENGYAVEEVTDFSRILAMVDDVGKPYLTPFSSPEHNDFTQGNVIWLVAWKDGFPAFLGCARIDELGSEAVGGFWARTFSRAYPQENGSEVIGDVRRDVEDDVSGRIVYFGDLFVNPSFRGSRLAIRAFVALGHLAVSLKWNPDCTYCFIRERDAMRGATVLYGFSRFYPSPFKWKLEPPKPRCRSEWLATLPRADLDGVTSATVSAVEFRQSEEKNSEQISAPQHRTLTKARG